MNRIFRITLHPIEGKQRKPFLLSGRIREDGWFVGRVVDQQTGDDKSWMDKQGVIHETIEVIQPTAVKKWTEYYADLRYGGLTPKNLQQQKKEYGIE